MWLPLPTSFPPKKTCHAQTHPHPHQSILAAELGSLLCTHAGHVHTAWDAHGVRRTHGLSLTPAASRGRALLPPHHRCRCMHACAAFVHVHAGVLQVEAMAQLAGLVMLDPEDTAAKSLFFFGGIEGCRFRKPVVPGDVLVGLSGWRPRGWGWGRGGLGGMVVVVGGPEGLLEVGVGRGGVGLIAGGGGQRGRQGWVGEDTLPRLHCTPAAALWVALEAASEGGSSVARAGCVQRQRPAPGGAWRLSGWSLFAGFGLVGYRASSCDTPVSALEAEGKGSVHCICVGCGVGGGDTAGFGFG